MDAASKPLSSEGKIAKIIVVIAAVVLFGVTLITNFFHNDIGKSMGWFINSTGGVSDVYSTEITPAGYAFSIWGIIYIFQGLMLGYIVANIFRKTEKGTRILFDPNFITTTFLVVYACNFVFNTGWIFLFDRSIANVKLLSAAAVDLWVILAFLVASVTFSYIDLNRERQTLIDYGLKVDIILVRVFIQNGISLYATWCAVASPLNVAISLIYVHNVSNENASTVALALLTVEIVIYVGLDTFVLDRWTRYTISPHLVLVWAISASLVKNYHPGKRNSIFTLVLLALAIAALIEKIILIIYRSVRSTDFEGYKINDSENSSMDGVKGK